MLRPLSLALSMLLSATLTFAQTTSATTATVTGTVTDQQGGVLPGVTATMSGPRMMGVQSRSPDGMASIASWRCLQASTSSFRAARVRHGEARGRATDGQVHRHHQHAMGVATMTENVHVTGESPVVDTQSTDDLHDLRQGHAGQSAERARLLGDSLRGAGRQAAAHRRRRQRAGTQTTYFVYGTTGQNRPMVEGINSTEGTGAFGNYVDYGSFEEVSIGSGASSAESPVPGVFTSARSSKSGGNQLPRLVLRRLRVEGLAVVQHRRGADRQRA